MHPPVLEWIKESRPATASHVLDIGGRDINGTARELFADAESYTVIDLHDGDNVDVVADVTEWDAPRRYDVIVCAEVLEHAENWDDIIEAACSMLADKGKLIVTAATHGRPPHSGLDEQPIRPDEWYENIDPGLLETILDQWFWDFTVDVSGTDVRAWAESS